jgi:broad specificity phosphatase PhoE
MDLYLVRHGVTAWNLAGRYQGWSDVELTSVGIWQARQTAAAFAIYRAQRHPHFRAIYSSPLSRAWHTASIIGDWLGLRPGAVPDLREMHGGAVEGLTQAEWQPRFPHIGPGWDDDANLDFGWPDGETRRAFQARCTLALNTIVARHDPSDHVIVVAHGGVIRAYLTGTVLDGLPVSRALAVDNCSITHIQFATEGAGTTVAAVGCLRVMNQVDHLHAQGADVEAFSRLATTYRD